MVRSPICSLRFSLLMNIKQTKCLISYLFVDLFSKFRMANIHHTVITSCRSQLVSELQKGDLDSLADDFYQKGMISTEELDAIQSTHERVKKARGLANALESKVKHYPSKNYYQVFLMMLSNKSHEYQTLIVALENKITELEGMCILSK